MFRFSCPRSLFSNYLKAFQESVQQPEAYWRAQMQDVDWFSKPTTILDDSKSPFIRWFVDGKINITHNLLDRHLERGLGNQVAYHIESPITGDFGEITISELHRRVSCFAGALSQNFKLKAGDSAVIYMPMTIESIIAQLACARLGVIHSVVFGGFAAPQLASRVKDCQPKVIICSNVGKEPNRIVDYESIVLEASKLSGLHDIPIIIHERSIKKRQYKASNWHCFETVEKSGSSISPTILDSSHPLYILYTSGTTGSPKGIYRDHGGTAVVLNHAMKNIYNLHSGDGLFCSSDIGWVLGHSFITYAPLLRAVRSILFEGKPIGTPDAGIFWRMIEKNKITHLYTSPTAIRGIRKEDPNGDFITKSSIECLKGVTFVGERCDVETFKWVQKHFHNRFINDTYWQTQTGSPILTNFIGLETYPMKPGSACKPVPGYNVKILNPETGKECAPHETGLIAVKLPTPPSFMLSLWNKDQAFIEKYFKKFEGYYDTGDSGYFDEQGYFHVMSRVDDIINTAGHRLSTGEMEEVIMKSESIAEAIVIGSYDDLKGEVPVGFVTIKKGYTVNAQEIQKEVVALIRKFIGPVASFKTCFVVERLPKTRSGKYLRHIVKKIYENKPYDVPSTIEDRSVVDEIQEFIEKMRK